MPTISTTDPFVRAVAESVARRSLLRRGDHVQVATSGGPSSTALAAVLAVLRKTLPIHLTLLHSRGTGEGEQAVRALAETLKVPLRIIDQPQEDGEDTPHDDRPYHARLWAAPDGPTLLATGETQTHADEVFFASLVSSVSPAELKLLKPREGSIIRPLFDVTRRECRAFLARYHFPMIHDPTLLRRTTLRDRVRLLLLPLLRHHIASDLAQTLPALREALADDVRFVDVLARAAHEEAGWGEHDGEVRLRVSSFSVLPRAIQRRILADAVRRLAPTAMVPPTLFEHVDTALTETVDGDVSSPALPQLKMARTGDTLLLRRL